MWILRWILGAILIIAILGFALQNQTQTVSVRILKWVSPVLPLYFFLYLSFIAGLLTWVLFSTLNILKLKGENHGLQRALRKTKEELNRLRNVNIDDEIDQPIKESDTTDTQDDEATTLETTS